MTDTPVTALSGITPNTTRRGLLATAMSDYRPLEPPGPPYEVVHAQSLTVVRSLAPSNPPALLNPTSLK